MEDCNVLAADCVVLTCCCQCLILQLLIFLFIRLPYKLLQNAKKYAKRKLCDLKRKEKAIIKNATRLYRDKFISIHGGSNLRIRGDGGGDEEPEGKGCMEEAEKVLEELRKKGVFGFGSFWGGDDETESILSTCSIT